MQTRRVRKKVLIFVFVCVVLACACIGTGCATTRIQEPQPVVPAPGSEALREKLKDYTDSP